MIRTSRADVENHPRKDFRPIFVENDRIVLRAKVTLGVLKDLCADLCFHIDPPASSRLTVYVVTTSGVRPRSFVNIELNLETAFRILSGGLWAVETEFKTAFQDALLLSAYGPPLPDRGPRHADA